MPDPPTARRGSRPLAAAARWFAFFVLWLTLIGADRSMVSTADLAVGAISSVLATWASLALLPPAGGGPMTLPAVRIMLRAVRQSALGGVDVACRAFRPSLPLRPGFRSAPVPIAEGTALETFCAVSSLVPGSLPVRTVEDGGPPGVVEFHCLDVDAPLEESVRADVAVFSSALRQPAASATEGRRA
jgi:multicomponent Na+:H+ antiporter subunit E